MPGTTTPQTRSPRRCRPFTVLDAMILVAALALGLAVMPHLLRDALESGKSRLTGPVSGWHGCGITERWEY